jgi:hypothetical protein
VAGGAVILSGSDLEAARRGLAVRRQQPALDSDILRTKLQAGLLPIATARDRGAATPQAAVETSLWAIHEADVDRLTQGIELTPEAAAEARQMIASVSGELQEQYQDPKRLVATLVVYAYTVAGYQIGDATPQPNTPAVWTVPISVQLEDGRSVNPTVPVHETDGGWQIVLDQNAVRQYASLLKQSNP